MKLTTVIAFAGLMAIAAPGMAQSVFDGTWRPDPESFRADQKEDIVELSNGVYACETCSPPYKIKADGSDQAIAGNPYYDKLSVAIVDDRTVIKTAKRGGKTVAATKIAVSSDNKTQTQVQTLYDMAPRPIEMTSHSARVAPGSVGAHLVSGGWRMTDADVSNHAEDTIFKVGGGMLSMSDQMGGSFSAKLDGTDAPYNGSDQFNSVSLKMIDAHTIEESDKKGGTVVKISRWSVSPDGKTMHVTFDDTHGHVQSQTGHKVP